MYIYIFIRYGGAEAAGLSLERSGKMENKSLILLVEHEESTGGFISAVLTSNNYNVIRAAKGREAISMTASFCPDLILLNQDLPDIGGLDVLKAIRLWTNLPVIFLSARVSETDTVAALDLGADDYIIKPFGTPEFLARIRTALRHASKDSEALPAKTIGTITIDYSGRRVTVGEKDVHLTPIEYKILALLSRHLGKVLTHEFLIKEVWGPYTRQTYSSELQALRVNMANIRRKLEEDPANPRYILTEVSVGYRMIGD